MPSTDGPPSTPFIGSWMERTMFALLTSWRTQPRSSKFKDSSLIGMRRVGRGLSISGRRVEVPSIHGQ